MDSSTANALMELLTPVLERLFKSVIDKIGQSDVTIGTSEIVSSITTVNENITCTNYLLSFIALLLLSGWLYSFFKDLFNRV